MSALPRDHCPVCDRIVPVRVNGTMRQHKARKHRAGGGYPPVPWCKGAGRKPKSRPLTGDQLELSV